MDDLSPEAAEGGTIALVQAGDRIEIDVESRKLELLVAEEELNRRREKLVHPPKKHPEATWTLMPAWSPQPLEEP